MLENLLLALEPNDDENRGVFEVLSGFENPRMLSLSWAKLDPCEEETERGNAELY